MKKIFCNVCGKEFDVYDEHNADVANISGYVGYGSKYDTHYIDLHMCNDCFDKLMDKMMEECKFSPIEDKGEFVWR